MTTIMVVVLAALLMGFRSGAGVRAWLAVAGILIQPVGTDIWIALAGRLGFLIVAYLFAMVAYRRKIT